MPLQLDDYDVSILKSLLKDGRKSFREISRETGITTPTVKARFNRLVNVGFIKSVSPILDFDIVERNVVKPQLQKGNNTNSKVIDKEDKTKNKQQYNNQHEQPQDTKYRIKKGIKIKLDCEFCKGPITGDPHVFRFANYERFFCCTSCMSGYKQKYAGRIESIKRKFEGKE
ncbi:MAG TPA: AsnC family transcriptional regulator [Nitrososphaeraceae archaeon]|nr:AsnC family transcriptional regulator [Nitrososphaeraceae archaeon]